MVRKSNAQLETTVTFQVTVFRHQSLDIKFCDFLGHLKHLDHSGHSKHSKFLEHLKY